jgi:hypothetical protein
MCRMTKKIKIQVTKGVTVAIDPSRMITKEELREQYVELVRKDKPRIEAELARRYPTPDDYAAEFERTRKLLHQAKIAEFGLTTTPPSDHTVQKTIVDAALANEAVPEFFADALKHRLEKMLRGAIRH